MTPGIGGWGAGGVIERDLAEIGIGQMGQQAGHDRVLAAAFPEAQQLVVQVAGRLAGDRRVIVLAHRAAFVAVAGGAGSQAFAHHFGRLCCACGQCQQVQQQAGNSEPSAKAIAVAHRIGSGWCWEG
ncbi:MAG: hypothetical protein Q8M37_07940 [Nevskia sp.]|nr:hypothetical protein [Nevskia sp.]